MAAATQTVPTLLTIEEYLNTSYRPDCDFVDGHLEERNVGDTQHSLLQVEVSHWFRLRKLEWKIRVLTELRTRVSDNRVRLPDVSVVLDDAALRDKIRLTPPLIAIEILSPDERMNRVIRRLEDFLAMGVQHVWLLDPIERVAYTLTTAGLQLINETRMSIPGSAIYLDLTELFSALD